MVGLNGAPEKPFSEPRREDAGGSAHWRARKRDIIFMLSPRVSTVLLPALVRAGRGRKSGRKSRDTVGGPVQTLSANTAVDTSRSLLIPRRQQCARSFRYLSTESSHRKTIESNREESDREVSLTTYSASVVKRRDAALEDSDRT